MQYRVAKNKPTMNSILRDNIEVGHQLCGVRVTQQTLQLHAGVLELICRTGEQVDDTGVA